MYLLKDEAMDSLLGDNFIMVLDLLGSKDITAKDLYCLQFKYESYDGFRKFYNKKLRPLTNKVKYINEHSFIGKIIKLFFRK